MDGDAVCEDFETNVVPNLYGTPSYGYRLFCLVFGVFVCVYLLVGFGLFCYYQQRFVRLQNRSLYMNLSLMLAFLLLNIVIYWREYIGRENIPCQLLIWSYYLSIYFAAGAIVGSQYLYLYKLRSQRDQGNAVALNWKNRGREQRVQSDQTNNSSTARSMEKTKNFFGFLYDFLVVLRHSKNGRIGTILANADDKDEASSANGSDSIAYSSLFLFGNENAVRDYSSTIKEKVLQTLVLPSVLMIAFGAPLIIAAGVRIALEPTFLYNCNGCTITYVDYLILTGCALQNLSMMAIGLYAMRNEADPIGIFFEVKIASYSGLIVIAGWILQSIDAGGVYGQYIFTWDILFSIGSLGCYFPTCYGQIINTYLERRELEQKRSAMNLARVDEHVATRITPHNAGNQGYSVKNLPPTTALSLNQIIGDPRARNALLEHCVDELSSENLVFVFKVRAWKALWERDPSPKVNKIALNIYQEYVSRISRTPINIPNHVCVEVEKVLEPYLASDQLADGSIASPLSSGKISRKVFDSCEVECLKIIQTDTLPRFRNSNLFKERIIETGILEKVLA